MNRRVSLLATSTVCIERFDHPPGSAHRDPEREHSRAHTVNFVQAGSFRLRADGAWQRLAPDLLFVARSGSELSYAHDEAQPADRCLSIRYTEPAAAGVRLFEEARRSPVHRLTNRLAYLGCALAACGPAHEGRAEMLAADLLGALEQGGARGPLYPPGRLAWYAARVERAMELMSTCYAEPLSLTVVARETGMSVFHFARVFSELAGQPPHRFLTGVRLAQAHARLRAGAGVSDTCLAVGFGSLSHFVTAFRRHFGIRPSDLRRGRREVAAGVRRSAVRRS